MSYYRARYYNPNVGRFVSEDPARLDIRLYRYVLNNPIIYIDPSGLAALSSFGTSDVIVTGTWNLERPADIPKFCLPGQKACTPHVNVDWDCDCTGSCPNWKADAQLNVKVEMFVPGPASIGHEKKCHILIAANAAQTLIDALEAITFGSQFECVLNCNKYRNMVFDTFRDKWNETQRMEVAGTLRCLP